ncbi:MULTISPECIES: hypothetical protein [unclassified Bradyrhizobium]|uniref:hypothetical protein n=1 Tax=unclassified Bradyrhizobium TaxID=2631580 RepID=UPI00291671E7|nr:MULTISPECIES: hypothetical protein [unclassified Bradyrhizobium]
MLGNILVSAAQVLFAAALDPIAQLIGSALVVMLGSAIVWHRRQRAASKLGMASWWFIGSSILIALMASSGAFYGLWLRGSQPAMPTADSPVSIPANIQSSPLVVEQSIIFGGGNYAFKYSGLLTRSGKIARVFIEHERSPADRRRVQLFEKRDFVKGEKLEGPLGSLIDGDKGHFRWGAANTGFALGDIVSFGEETKARLLIIDENGVELQEYGFLLLPQITDGQVDVARYLNTNARFRHQEENIPVPEISASNVKLVVQDKWKWQ